MTSRIFQQGLLQQQPLRPLNRQQQESSGSGEFQPQASPSGQVSHVQRQVPEGPDGPANMAAGSQQDVQRGGEHQPVPGKLESK